MLSLFPDYSMESVAECPMKEAVSKTILIVVVAEGLPKDSKKFAELYSKRNKKPGLETRKPFLVIPSVEEVPQPPTVFWQRSLALMLPN